MSTFFFLACCKFCKNEFNFSLSQPLFTQCSFIQSNPSQSLLNFELLICFLYQPLFITETINTRIVEIFSQNNYGVISSDRPDLHKFTFPDALLSSRLPCD